MQRTPSAAAAVKIPPSCLSGFDCTALPLAGNGLDLAVDFALTCRSCNAFAFLIFGFPIVAPDPSPYYAVEPGQTFFRPPHKLRCSSCGAEAALFDVRKDGYDGVLNGGASYESGTDGEEPIAGQFKVTVAVFFNVEFDELSELAAEANVSISNLFDCITIKGTPVNGGEDVELSYECA
ncbi:hypothetical protein [Parvularcula sp. LCG005]|uniref:hypothetical protein n=1 Tax=Parvularcula sp. LCG005 TaxID=3078805 RepID=UPI00294278DD|nr:hypothetical protein [Parvularcula sp. LCG005]WOI54397.1 hypothetical protein RUI03_05185 [Parvularcula sp. LCG005]